MAQEAAGIYPRQSVTLFGITSQALKVLPGDGSVSSSDLVGINNQTVAQTYDPWADINGDGAVTTSDVLATRPKVGTHLP